MKTLPEFIDDIQFARMHEDQSREDQLEAMLNNLKQVFVLTTKKYDTFSELVRAYLVAGNRIFEMETGIVSQISDCEYRVLDVVSSLDAIAPGDVFPLEGTYCREVYQSGEVIGFPRVGELDYMKNHPVYENLQLEAYISAPIWVDGRIFGTLNFTSRKPRDNGFSVHERDMITLMASAISNFIVLRDRENTLKKFVGFVAHDMRNPLGCIRNYAELAQRETVSTEKRLEILKRIEVLSGVGLDFVSSVLELSALEAGKLTPVPGAVVLDEVIALVENSLIDLLQAKKARIVHSCPPDLVVWADQSMLYQIFSNLVTNAIKYAPESSEIHIGVALEADCAHVVIRNEKEPSQSGKYSQGNGDLDIARFRSIGFGLDIAREALAAQGIPLDIGETAGEFQVQFDLPLEKTALKAS